MLHTAVLRSPHAARDGARASTWRRRSRCRACTPRSGRARSRSSSTTATTRAQAVAAVCADTLRAGASRARGDRRRVGRAASRCSIPTRRCGASVAARRAPRARARRLRARPRRGRRRRLGRVPTAVVLHNSMETHQAVVQWVGDSVEVHISTQYIWGIRDAVAERARAAARQGARDLPLHGRRLRLEERRRTTTRSSRRSSRSAPGRPVKCALTRREENVAAGNRNATIQRLTIGAQQRRHADRARRRVRQRGRLGAAGRPAPKGRCRCSTRARTSGRRPTARRSTSRR